MELVFKEEDEEEALEDPKRVPLEGEAASGEEESRNFLGRTACEKTVCTTGGV
jgi:hypothetical protein